MLLAPLIFALCLLIFLMKIDVIIATHNRASLLERAVRSILENKRELPFDYTITIVDNNSSDETPQVVARLAQESGGHVRYLHEPRQGKSFAVNAGISATKGDVIAFADDDQRMGKEWLGAICQAIADGYDYVTGPVYGEWKVEPPEWYDNRLHGVLSIFEGGDERVPHEADESQHGFSGGNGAVRRSVIERIGGYHIELGKHAGKFVMCEDGELFIRFKRSGFRGIYEPRMKVFHLVLRERVTKKYFRRWHRGYGRSMALVDTLHPKPVSSWFGVPRFLVRRTIEALPRMLTARLQGDLPGAFEQELNLWFMLGFIGGKISSKPSSTASDLNGDGILSDAPGQR